MENQTRENNEHLRRGLEYALSNPLSYMAIERGVAAALINCGLALDVALEFVRHSMKGTRIVNLFEFERMLRVQLEQLGTFRSFDDVLRRRDEAWLEAIKPGLDKVIRSKKKKRLRILELGAGAGGLGVLLSELGHEVELVDVLDYRRGKALAMKFHLIEQGVTQIPGVGKFDLELDITVRHHASNPRSLVELGANHADRILMIETVDESFDNLHYVLTIDWFWNRIMFYSDNPNEKVNVPGQWRSVENWKSMFWVVAGFMPVWVNNLSIFQWGNPEPHSIFLFRKYRQSHT